MVCLDSNRPVLSSEDSSVLLCQERFFGLLEQLTREFLWTEAKDVWCISLDPVWGDFIGARAVGSNKPVPFLDSVPITIWLHTHLDPNSTIKSEGSGPKNADIHALAHISNLVSLQINHYQFLFLLRLAEEAAELATFISIDSNKIKQVESDGSLIVGALVPQLEVTFVMPSQNPGKESSGGDVESFIPDSSSIPDDIFAGSTATVWQQSTLSIPQHDAPKSPKNVVPNGGDVAMSSMMNEDIVPQMATSFSTLPDNFNNSIKSMRKGFSSLMTSIDSALKPSLDDGSDSVSIRSGSSSDSENFVVVNYGNEGTDFSDAMFFVPEFQSEVRGIVEMASEVIEEENTITTASDPSFSSCKRKDLVSVATFRLNKVEFLQQSIGYSSSIKVQVDNISNDDCNSIPWDEFQSKFSSRGRAWSYTPPNSNTTTRVKLRMDHDLTLPSSRSMETMDFSDKDLLKKMFRNNVVVQVCDLNLDLSMSTVTGLTDLVEDEIIAPPIPLEVTVDNIQLHLIEDRPPANITSPGPVPINLSISHLFITRGEDGTFHITPGKNSMTASTSSLTTATDTQILKQQANRQLRQDNDELKRRLLAFERVSLENCALRRSKEESDILRSCLTSAQEEVARLLDEKKKLLDEIRRLQEQSLTERARQWSNKR